MAEVKSLVFRYVFVYYNRIRVYTANPGGWSPETWRRMYFEQAARTNVNPQSAQSEAGADVPIPASLDRTPGKCCGETTDGDRNQEAEHRLRRQLIVAFSRQPA